MRRKDINLLYSLTQATKKKSSSNIMVVLGVLVLAVIGVMVFLFVDAKGEVSDNEALIKDLDSKLSGSLLLGNLQRKYDAMKAAYESDIADVIAEIAPSEYAGQSGKMSAALLDILMLTDEENEEDSGYDADGEADNVFDVDIKSIAISGTSVNITCAVVDYLAAWDFTDYLAGIATYLPEALEERVELNARLFAGVQDNYSGLPQLPGNGEPIEFTLRFVVADWGALV